MKIMIKSVEHMIMNGMYAGSGLGMLYAFVLMLGDALLNTNVSPIILNLNYTCSILAIGGVVGIIIGLIGGAILGVVIGLITWLFFQPPSDMMLYRWMMVAMSSVLTLLMLLSLVIAGINIFSSRTLNLFLVTLPILIASAGAGYVADQFVRTYVIHEQA